MDCALPEVLDALNGRATASDVRMVLAPPELDGRARPRAVGKAVYGESLASHLETANFTLQWDDATLDPARAQDLADALEGAWQALVVDGGWPAPVSSDAYLLRATLVPNLGPSGYTTVYTDDAYPQGYPVMYLDPTYLAATPAFAESVAVHEFGHTLHYRLRDWQGTPTEAWYWEATGEWLAELGAPDLDTYAWSTAAYAQAPAARYDSLAAQHPYGMLLLDAYVEEYVGVPVRDIWLASADRPTDDWADIIGDAVGVPFAEIVADMAGAVAAHALRESGLYSEPLRGELYVPELFGTLYVDLDGPPPRVTGDLAVRYATEGAWGPDYPDAPCVMAVTAVGYDGEIGGEDLPDDVLPAEEPPEGCACDAGPRAPWLALILAAVLTRRRAPTGPFLSLSPASPSPSGRACPQGG